MSRFFNINVERRWFDNGRIAGSNLSAFQLLLCVLPSEPDAQGPSTSATASVAHRAHGVRARERAAAAQGQARRLALPSIP